MTRHVFRFFVAGEHSAGATVALSGSDTRHAQTVLRLREGAACEVADGAGTVWRGEMLGQGMVALHERLATQVEGPAPTVWLALAGGRGDLAVEKLSELGVAAIGALTAEKARGSARLDRWARLSEAAARQSKRARLPRLEGPASVAEVVAEGRARALLLDHEAPDAAPCTPARDAVLLIGPEAGWSEGERRAARAAGAPLWRLGDTTLRSETAAIAAAALALFGP